MPFDEDVEHHFGGSTIQINRNAGIADRQRVFQFEEMLTDETNLS